MAIASVASIRLAFVFLSLTISSVKEAFGRNSLSLINLKTGNATAPDTA